MVAIQIKQEMSIQEFESGWTSSGRRDHGLRALLEKMDSLTVVVISHDGRPCREGRAGANKGPCRLSSKVTRFLPKDGRRFHTRHLENGDFAIACYPK